VGVDRLGLDAYESEFYDEVREVLPAGQPPIFVLASSGSPLDALLARAATYSDDEGDDREGPWIDTADSDDDLDDEGEVGHDADTGDAFSSDLVLIGDEDDDTAVALTTARIIDPERFADGGSGIPLHPYGGDPMFGDVQPRPPGSTFEATHWGRRTRDGRTRAPAGGGHRAPAQPGPGTQRSAFRTSTAASCSFASRPRRSSSATGRRSLPRPIRADRPRPASPVAADDPAPSVAMNR
jgi:hypothetical protein